MMAYREKVLPCILIFMLLFVIGTTWSVDVQAKKQKQLTLTWVSTGTKGITYGLAIASATLINKYSPLPGLPKLKIAVVPGKGSTAHPRQLMNGEIDIALGTPSATSDAYNAKGAWAKYGDKGKELRILFPMCAIASQIFSMWDGPVKSFNDIKGKRLGEMSKSMGMQKVDAAVWKAAGLDRDKDMKTTYYSTMAAQLDALRDGHADAIILTQGYPGSGPTELLTTKHCRLISVPDEVVNKAASKNRSWYPVTISPNTYPGQDYPVKTMGLVVFWGTTTNLDDDAAYEICKIVHEHKKEGAELWAPFGQLNPGLFVDFGVPMHSGAARYWKEIGWIK